MTVHLDLFGLLSLEADGLAAVALSALATVVVAGLLWAALTLAGIAVGLGRAASRRLARGRR